MKRQINKSKSSVTYDQYLEKYFPKTEINNEKHYDKPEEFGVVLARQSLIKIHKTLSNLK